MVVCAAVSIGGAVLRPGVAVAGRMCYGVEAVVRKEIDVVNKSPIRVPCLLWEKNCYPSVGAGIVVELYSSFTPCIY